VPESLWLQAIKQFTEEEYKQQLLS